MESDPFDLSVHYVSEIHKTYYHYTVCYAHEASYQMQNSFITYNYRVSIGS